MPRAHQPPPGQHPVTYDQPLPGHYPTLTLQLNVTRYQSASVGRMVLVVREPSDHVEVVRSIEDTQDWEEIWPKILAHVASALERTRYLQDGENT